MFHIKQIPIQDIPDRLEKTVFGSKQWLSVYPTQNLIVYGIFNLNSEIIGFFSTYKGKQLKVLSHIKTPPFSQHIGLFYENPAQHPAKKIGFDKKVIKAVAKYLQEHKKGILTLALPYYITDTQPFFWGKFKIIPHYTYVKNLSKPEKDLKSEMDSKLKNSLKKGDKDGLVCTINKNYQLVEDFVNKTMEKNDVSIDKQLLKNIITNLSKEQNSFSFISKLNNDVLAMTCCVYDKETCYYLLGGYNQEKSHPAAGPMAVWNSILYAKELGLSRFDFEGSMIPPIEKYFRSFGGDITPYYTINKSSFFLESLLKFKKRNTF